MRQFRCLLLLVLILVITFQTSCLGTQKTQTNDYLLVTLDEVYIKNSTDKGGEGEITIWTLTKETYSSGSGLSKSLSQGNAFPHPSSYWVEAKDGSFITPEMPIYLAKWEDTPDELFFLITAMDNDQGPSWLNDGIKGLGEVMVFIGGGAGELAQFILSLPSDQVQELVGKDWFLAQIVHYFWKDVLEKADLFEMVKVVNRYGHYVEILGGITKMWGKYIEAPETVSAMAYRSSEFFSPLKVSPTKKNDWGLADNRSKATFNICAQQNYVKDQGCKEPIAHISFHRITEPTNPVSINVTLKSLYFKDVREPSSDAEIFIHSRYAEFPIRVAGIPGAPAEFQGKYEFQGDTYFLTADSRIPRSGFINFQEKFNYPIGQTISGKGMENGKPPFAFVEVDLFEDDSGAIFEDKVDWLGTFTWLFFPREMISQGMLCKTFESIYASAEICATVVKTGTEPTQTSQTALQPVIPFPIPATFYLGFDTSKPPFDNAQVRQAFSLTIDKAQLLNRIDGENRSLATSFVHPDIWPEGFDAYKEIGLPFDPILANMMIDQLALDGDLPLVGSVTLAVPDSETSVQIAEFIEESWKEYLGVDVEIMSINWDEYLDRLSTSEEINAYLLGWKADYARPDNFLYDVFNSQSASNHSHYQNPYYESLLTNAWQESDLQTTLQIYLDAERLLCEQDAVIVPLYYYYVSE